MSNYIKKAAAHARLLKLASAARLIRRQRALQKYAQAVQMQKQALSGGAATALGAGVGGLLGGGIGYGLGGKKNKLLSTLIGAGAGAGLGAGGVALYRNLTRKGVDPVDAQAIVSALSPEVTLPGGPLDPTLTPITDRKLDVSPITRMPSQPPVGGYTDTQMAPSANTMIATSLAGMGEAQSGVRTPFIPSDVTSGSRYTAGNAGTNIDVGNIVHVPQGPIVDTPVILPKN